MSSDDDLPLEFHHPYSWTSKKKEKSSARKDRIDELKTWYLLYKSKLSCRECGESDPYLLDFHHEKPEFKKFGIAEGVARGYSKARIMLEISKCIPLCSNCHRNKERYGNEIP